ncbi:hypothetical protein C8R44DRAFT_52761 [Mycena epipterygia]|nr:hypothetical protein C8R44DRAFT_52761 [Mycena epipterygia]
MESNGACDTLDAIIATPNSGLTSDDKASYMAPIKDAINSKDNLYFLDSKLNQVKRDEVTASLKGKTPATSSDSDLNDQYIAVNDYLSDSNVNRPSTSMATKLDGLVQAMLKQAGDDALTNIKGCGSTSDEQKLQQAQAKFKPPGVPSVTSSWKDVLDYVAKQAALADGSCSNSQSSKRANCNRPSATVSGQSSTASSQKSGTATSHASSARPASSKQLSSTSSQRHSSTPRASTTRSASKLSSSAKATPTASTTIKSTSSSDKPTPITTKSTSSSASAAQPTTSSSIDPTKWYTLTSGNNNYLNSVDDVLTSINFVSLDPPEPGMQFQFPQGLFGRMVSQVHTDKAVGLAADNKTWSTNTDKSLVSTFGTANSRNVALAFNGMSVGGDGSGKLLAFFCAPRITIGSFSPRQPF